MSREVKHNFLETKTKVLEDFKASGIYSYGKQQIQPNS